MEGKNYSIESNPYFQKLKSGVLDYQQVAFYLLLHNVYGSSFTATYEKIAASTGSVVTHVMVGHYIKKFMELGMIAPEFTNKQKRGYHINADAYRHVVALVSRPVKAS